MISPKQVSESLGVPTATVRRWAVKFAPYLSQQSRKKRQYTIEDMAIFAHIKELSAQGFSAVKIAGLLAVVPEPVARGAELLAINDFVSAITIAQSNIQTLTSKIDAQEKRLASLEDYIKRPWYERLFKRPPIE
jgi:DNA-binding transcriptional MerR regulator